MWELRQGGEHQAGLGCIEGLCLKTEGGKEEEEEEEKEEEE